MKSTSYDHRKIEKHWQEVWAKEKTYSPDMKSAEKPFYNLMMFPYPSAEGLHVGNMYAFTGADVFGRFKRMQGYDVFEPIGLDGFGIHSENYAIKVGRHPKEHAKISEEHFYKQLHQLGNGFDWTRKLETYHPDYYKWTQWLFVQMFKAGLAYKDSAMVNWCPGCKTVLADEQIIDGKCERSGDETERREMSSWYFRITKYADRLLDNIEKIDWPEKIKIAQRQWIGKSKGLTINFSFPTSYNLPPTTFISVWTKFWETIYGVTFIVVSPEYAHDNLIKLVPKDLQKEVSKYINTSLNKSEQERKANKEKSGVLTGIEVINPVNGDKVPVFVADYVLSGVGTGAVMGVPAHDERDFQFAKKYELKNIQVVSYADEEVNSKVSKGEMSYEGEGKLLNSGSFDGLEAWGEGKAKMADWMIEKGFAKWETNYHLRDWLISRQRYWGPPIPMVNCKDCGWQSVPEADLPVVLPDIKEFKPQGDGTSPLHNAPESWKKVKCPNCGKEALRELDVSDTFLDSSWYFLRYPSVGLKDVQHLPWSPEVTKRWLPVNAYIGGAEHAVLHLLYARFVTMFLKDQGHLSFEEPFPFLFGHGLIIKDGAKMSKSKGNIVNPDEYIEKFGADALRCYLMFLGPFDQGGDFRDTGIEGMTRFLMRFTSLFEHKIKPNKEDLMAVCFKTHKTIKKVTDDIAEFKYNTSIAAMMELVNLMGEKGTDNRMLKVLTKLLAPFVPHLTEELWHTHFKEKGSIHLSSWPKYDEKYLMSTNVQVVVQVNGKLRATLDLTPEQAKDKEYVLAEAKKLENVNKWIEGGIKKEIFVPGKLVNFVV